MNTGTVRWFSYSKGCGFIVPDDGGADVFAHFSRFGDAARKSLDRNQRVRYRVAAGPKGPVASHIHALIDCGPIALVARDRLLLRAPVPTRRYAANEE
jgi:CspA family cold shock protein